MATFQWLDISFLDISFLYERCIFSVSMYNASKQAGNEAKIPSGHMFTHMGQSFVSARSCNMDLGVVTSCKKANASRCNKRRCGNKKYVQCHQSNWELSVSKLKSEGISVNKRQV